MTKYFCIIFIGILNVTVFNTVCKNYYLLRNKNNVGIIYIDQQFPFSGRRKKSSKIELYHKLYAMESTSVRNCIALMLKKEARVYPYLVFCQFLESVPKLIIFVLLFKWVDPYQHIIIVKLIVCMVSIVCDVKACFLSCFNNKFNRQFDDTGKFEISELDSFY